ncbi:PAN domain-containing protein [Rhodoplanes sp. SY1]|uniref:PAN domain-containing protein n=1 Tax=Rhodoplanes sp. SY1 TaxID=3166646 RepID=UPI0038B5DE88
MDKLGIVVLGASTFEFHPDLDNPRFLYSAREFLKALRGNNVAADRKPEILDLFDRPYAPDETIDRIADFASRPLDGIVVYYCGHGDAPRDKEYRVFLRKSKRERRNATLLSVQGLIHDVERVAIRKQLVFVLDACYSGEVIKQMSEYMDAAGAETLLRRAFADSIAHMGTAIVAAAGGEQPALAKHEDELTLFTGAVVNCLRDGVSDLSGQPTLSWSDVRNFVETTTRARLGSDAPVPQIYSPADHGSGVAGVPFFENKAHRTPAAQSSSDKELVYWLDIRDSRDPADIGTFLRKFPTGTYAPLARIKVRELARTQTDPVVLERFMREHPALAEATSCRRHLAALRWAVLRTSPAEPTKGSARETMIDQLREFVLEFQEMPEGTEAYRRLAELSWIQLAGSTDINVLERFTNEFEDAPQAEIARSKIDELRTARGGQLGWRSAFRRAASWSVQCIRRPYLASLIRSRLVAPVGGLAALVGAFVYFPLIVNDGPAVPELYPREEDERIFAGLGSDRAKLLGYVNGCRGKACWFVPDATERIRQIDEDGRLREADRLAYVAIGNDSVKLAAYLKDCETKTCGFAADAKGRLDKIRAEQQAREVDRAAYAAAGNDPVKLAAYVKDCETKACGFAVDAKGRLDKIRSEQQAREVDRTAYAAAGNDPVKLAAYVKDCETKTCGFATDAKGRLDKIRAEQQARQADLVAFSTAGEDPTKLRSYIDGCRGKDCMRLGEATSLLAAVENEVRAAKLIGYEPAALQRCSQSCRFAAARVEADALLRDIRQDEQAYLGARGRLDALSAYAATCRVCRFKPDASREIAALQMPPAGFRLYSNHDIYGGDIERLRNSDLNSCEAACRSNTACRAYSFDKWNRDCYLKSGTTEFRRDPQSEVGIKRDVAEPQRSSSALRICTYGNSTLSGSEIATGLSQSAATCRQSCEGNDACAGYTFLASESRCRLFSNPNDRTSKQPNAESGIKTQRSCS